jgi:hypothetical protein
MKLASDTFRSKACQQGRAMLCWALVAALPPGLAFAQEQAQTAAAAAVAPVQQVFDFDVNLDKRPIGTHRFTVSRQTDGATRIQSDASFEVRVLGIVAYRYRHQATERWQGECLAAIEASTHDNGRSLHVSGLRRDGGFQLQQPAAVTLPACLAAYAYWNRDLLLRQPALLNPQTGRFDALRVEAMGRETLELKGRAVPAERYRLHAAQNVIDLWYSLRGDWLRLESTTGSRRLVYRLKSVP